MRVLEIISLIALSVFAASLDPLLFAPFLAFGVILGVYMHWNKSHQASHLDIDGGCSQGFLEQLTGIKLPALLGLAVNIALMWCHIDHHSQIFVPIIGLNTGIWIGKLATHYLPLCHKKICCIHGDRATAHT